MEELRNSKLEEIVSEKVTREAKLSSLYSITYGDYTVISYFRIVEDQIQKLAFSSATHLEIKDNISGSVIIIRDLNNDETVDEVTINPGESHQEILIGREADGEYGIIFRGIQNYLLDNALVCTQYLKKRDKYDLTGGVYLFIPKRDLYVC